jgi:Zn-dependent metalloprotease
MSHGVTAATANLNYSGESGGLNEATSDIFGTMVEFYANNSSDTPDYLIGEKLYISNPTGGNSAGRLVSERAARQVEGVSSMWRDLWRFS